MIVKRPEKQRDVTFVCGVTGAGKSYFTRRMILKYPRVILVSPIEADEQEYDGIQCDSLTELLTRLDEYRNKKRKFWYLKLSDLSDFDMLCAAVYEMGDCTLVIEEAQRIIPSKCLLGDSFKDILYRGRHKLINVIVISQRASTVSIEFRSQWRRIVSFRQSEPSDVRWLMQSTGYEELEKVNALPDRAYFDITPHSFERVGEGVK